MADAPNTLRARGKFGNSAWKRRVETARGNGAWIRARAGWRRVSGLPVARAPERVRYAHLRLLGDEVAAEVRGERQQDGAQGLQRAVRLAGGRGRPALVLVPQARVHALVRVGARRRVVRRVQRRQRLALQPVRHGRTAREGGEGGKEGGKEGERREKREKRERETES